LGKREIVVGRPFREEEGLPSLSLSLYLYPLLNERGGV